MARDINQHLAFKGGAELQNAKLERLASDPSGSGLHQGRVWLNTTTSQAKYYDGAAIQPFPSGNASTDMAVTQTPTGATFVSGGGASDTLGFATGADAGLLSPANFTKLEGVESNAKDDQASSEVPSTGVGNLPDGTVATQLEELANRVSNAAGNIVGQSTTYAGLPTVDTDGSTLDVGDIAYLTADDGANLRGDYRWDGAAWILAIARGGSAGAATTTAAGVVELATSAEAQAGTDVSRAVTPAALESSHVARTFTSQFGDGSPGPFTIAHGLGTASLLVQVSNAQGTVGVDYSVDATNIVISPLGDVAASEYTVKAIRVG